MKLDQYQFIWQNWRLAKDKTTTEREIKFGKGMGKHIHISRSADREKQTKR